MRAAEEPLRSDPDGAGAQGPGPLAHREAGVAGAQEVGTAHRDHPREGGARTRRRGREGGDRWVGFGRAIGCPRLCTVAANVVSALGFLTSWETSSLRESLFIESVNSVLSKVA